MNVSPIPVIAHSKIPAVDWKMWQNRTPPKKIIDYWFGDKELNIGVICGGRSNLAIIDFDDINSYYDWRRLTVHSEKYRDLATKSYRVRTARGMHVYTRTDKQETSRKYPETKIDIRCQANYTLVPPSIHPSGVAYEAIGNIDLIVPIDTLETMFPDPIKKYKSDTIDIIKPEKTDIFSMGEVVENVSDIKNTISVLSFVSQFTQVRRTSTDGRWWMARCINPIHKDKSPSFRIDRLNNRAKCLSSSCAFYHDIGYDVIDLYSLINRIPVSQAIREMIEIYL
jgi:hypothetical protein